MTATSKIEHPTLQPLVRTSPAGRTTGFATPRNARASAVLLHSSASSARQWDALAHCLRPHFDVHAIDLYGHGRQPPWRHQRPLTVLDEADLALPHLERAGGAHLIGHSYGAAIAMHLAATRPSLVRSLTVFEPVLFSLLVERDPQGRAALEVLDVAQTVRGHVFAGQLSRAAEHFVTYWSGAQSWQRLNAQQQTAIAARMPMVTQHFDATYAASLSADRLARLRMPMLCLSGGRSTAAARQISALMRTLMPQATHESLAELGHLGPITHPQVVNDRVLRFIELECPQMPMTAT